MIRPRWGETGHPITRAIFGHNAVWCRGGLGVWDEGARDFDPDALAAVRALSPGVVRFPGGTRAMRWHFEETVGPYETRRPQCDPFRGVLDGTSYGLDEGLRFAERVSADVTLVSAWVDGSPQETAALVAYVNGDADSAVRIGIDAAGRDWGTAGEWARRRIDSGRAAPYGVPYLEIGNEPYLGLRVGAERSCGRDAQFRQCERWVGDAVTPTTARFYADEVVETSALVRAIAPAMKIGACALGGLFDYEDPETAIGAADEELGTHDPWNPRLLGSAGHAFDFWIVHPYIIEATDARLRLGARLSRCVRGLRNLDPSRPIAVTEHGFLLGGDTMMNALASVDVVRVALEERLVMALRHLLIEDDPSGPFASAAAILGPERRSTPAYHAMALLAGALRGEQIPVEGSERALVARDGDALTVVLYRLDRGPVRTLEVALPGRFSGQCTALTAASLEAREVERAVTPIAATELLSLELPEAGLAVVELRAESA